MRGFFYCLTCDAHWGLMWTPFKPMPKCQVCGNVLDWDEDYA